MNVVTGMEVGRGDIAANNPTRFRFEMGNFKFDLTVELFGIQTDVSSFFQLPLFGRIGRFAEVEFHDWLRIQLPVQRMKEPMFPVLDHAVVHPFIGFPEKFVQSFTRKEMIVMIPVVHPVPVPSLRMIVGDVKDVHEEASTGLKQG
jgi:hypothetical protein